MDKRTLLAVVISVAIFIAGTIVQQLLFPPAKPSQGVGQPAATQPVTPTGQSAQAVGQSSGGQAQSTAAPAPDQARPTPAAPGEVVPAPDSGQVQAGSQVIVRETDLFTLAFSRDGGVLESIKLKKYKNVDGTPVEMVLPSTTGQYPFDISFGDYKAPWTTAPFALKETVDSAQSVFDFSRSYLSTTGVPFVLHKIYRFYNDEYMMELKVSVENSVNDIPNLGPGQFAYALSVGPQIGPRFQKLDGRSDYRSFIYYADGKRKDLGNLSGSIKELDQRMSWAGIVGKYFTVLVVPDAAQYRFVFDARKLTPELARSTMYLERPAIQAAKSQDVYRFYIGPKTRASLGLYNDRTKNRFGIADLHLDSVITSPFLIGWLAQLLNWVLELFYLLIPNYGVAIILLTLFTKLIFLPLTFKSSEATARMQSLNPKIAEIRERLKGKPDKMNQEIAELYKREKVNPLSGCLPMLLQIPIFFALYSLLNDNFALRGAMFIPYWIPDLSVPESVWSFPFTIPLLGWQNLRLLPFLMVATQFFSTRFTTPRDASQSTGQMKLFGYALPAVFFFILYDMPSGLVLYWTIQNMLSVFQQLYINYVNKKKKELAVKAETTNSRRR